MLGNARRCGYWEKGTLWPLPIGPALRRMERKLYDRLGLQEGARVLDAGAGSGFVASYMAEHGLRVHGVDLTPLHVDQAKRTIHSRGLDDGVHVELGDTTTCLTCRTAPSTASTPWKRSCTPTTLTESCETSTAS
jgi:sterol 24-C-methyltransferase